MSVKVNRLEGNGTAVELFLSASAVSGLGLQRVIPAPETTTVGNGGLTYRSRAAPYPSTSESSFNRWARASITWRWERPAKHRFSSPSPLCRSRQ